MQLLVALRKRMSLFIYKLMNSQFPSELRNEILLKLEIFVQDFNFFSFCYFVTFQNPSEKYNWAI